MGGERADQVPKDNLKRSPGNRKNEALDKGEKLGWKKEKGPFFLGRPPGRWAKQGKDTKEVATKKSTYAVGEDEERLLN